MMQPHVVREEGHRGPSKTLLYDIIHKLANRVLLTKLVELDGDICLYFSALMMIILA